MAKSNIIRTFKNYGLWYSLHRAYQLSLRLPIKNHNRFVDCVKNKHGLEVGGPSAIFATGGLIPLYEYVGSLDNCNFGAQTLWAKHDLGKTFQFSASKPAGRQFVAEGADLREIGDSAYDFVLSSHMLEHTANPLKALQSWRRVLKKDGHLILLIPDREFTFDHCRPVTSLAHLIEDFTLDVGEDDLTHLSEVIRLHDLRRDPDAGGFEEFTKRCENNLLNRGMHHHVFDEELVTAMLCYSGFSVRLLRRSFKDHIIAVAN